MADQPTPKYVVDDSKLKASISTVFSLVFFGITLAGALFARLSAHDINGVREILMRETTLQWLTTIAPFMWLGWRTVRAWWKKKRDIEIVDSADNAVAMRKSLLAEPIADPAPTRARETTTRLRDRSVLGLKVEPTPGVPAAPPATATLMPLALEFADEKSAVAAALRSAIDDGVVADVAGQSWGSNPQPPNSPGFDAVHARYVAEDATCSFPEYLEAHGWAWNGKRWEKAVGQTDASAPRIAGDPLDLQPPPAKK